MTEKVEDEGYRSAVTGAVHEMTTMTLRWLAICRKRRQHLRLGKTMRIGGNYVAA